MRVTNASIQMPASTATVKTVAKKAPVRRKRATAKKTVTPKTRKAAVAKVTTPKRPSTRNLISGDRYLKDIQTRWAIHQFEIHELGKDISKGFNFVKKQIQEFA